MTDMSVAIQAEIASHLIVFVTLNVPVMNVAIPKQERLSQITVETYSVPIRHVANQA